MSISMGMGRRSVGPARPCLPAGSVTPMDWTRAGIGAVTIALLGAALALWANGETGQAGITARVGVMMAAAWIAWPAMRRTPRRSWMIAGVAVALVAWRPRSAWVVLPVLAFVMRRPRSR